jgi:hypothetical protein
MKSEATLTSKKTGTECSSVVTMYVCVCVCKYVCMYVCMYVCTGFYCGNGKAYPKPYAGRPLSLPYDG